MNPKQTKIIAVGAVLMLALMAAAYYFGVSPQMKKASEHKTAAEAATQTTATLQSTLTSLQQKQGELDKASGQYRQLSRQFPEDFDGSVWVGLIVDAATRTGVTLDKITPSIPTVATPGTTPGTTGVPPVTAPVPGTPGTAPVEADPSAMLASSAVTLSVSGSPTQIRAFVKAVGLLDRPLLVTSTNVTNAESGVTAEIIGTTYLMRALPEPGSAEEQAEGAATAETEIPAP